MRDDTADALRDGDPAVGVVLHERADPWAMADRIVVMFDGLIHADGAPQELLNDPPTPEVARFLGYDGELTTDTGVLLTRAAHVRVLPDANDAGTVARVVRTVVIEDGLRVQLRADRGNVWSVHRGADLRAGDEVRVSIDAGAAFPDLAESLRPGRRHRDAARPRDRLVD